MYGAGQGKNPRYYQRFTYWHLEKSQISERKFQQSEVVVLQQPLSFRQSRRCRTDIRMDYGKRFLQPVIQACISTIEVGTEQRSLKTLRITDYTPEVRQSEGEGKRYVNNPDELQRFKYKDELIFCKGFNVFRCNKFDYELHPEAKKLL